MNSGDKPTTRVSVVAVQLLVGMSAFAQPCVTDTTGSGHPLFGSTYQRSELDSQFFEPGGGHSTGMAFADLDDDGWVDAVVADNLGADGGATSYLAILFGAGDGVFEIAVSLTTPEGWETADVVAIDLDDDGDADIACTNAWNNSVSVFLNLGDRAFSEMTVHGVGDMPRSIEAADVDGDGLVDLLTLNVESDDVSILRNMGGGAFARAVHVGAGEVTERGEGNLNFPYPGPFMDVGDIDADGDLDIAVPANKEVEILLNDGRGNFELAEAHPTGIALVAYDVAIGDLDSDGMADVAIAVSIEAEEGFTVVMNEGSPGEASWGAPVGYDVTYHGAGPRHISVALADIDGDGDLDGAVGQEVVTQLHVMRNQGDGTFVAEARAAPDGPWVVELEDVNADGLADLAILNDFTVHSGLHAWLNDGQGDLLGPERVISGVNQAADGVMTLKAGDLDGDGDADGVGVSVRFVRFLRNDDGVLSMAPEIALESPSHFNDVEIGDLNGDGLVDLVLSDETTAQSHSFPGRVRVLLSEGDFSWTLAQTLEPEDLSVRAVEVADIDADGDLDVLAAAIVPLEDFAIPEDRRLLVFVNDGSGRLEQSQEITYAHMSWWGWASRLDIGDVDGDGDVDAIASAAAKDEPGIVAVFVNDGRGTYSKAGEVEVPFQMEALSMADLDGDGVADFVIGQNEDELPYHTVYLNDGSGDFQPAESYGHPNFSRRGEITLADVDLDGDIDILSADADASVIVQLNQGDATFDAHVRYGSVAWNESVDVGDFDLDGRPDLLVGNANLDTFTVLCNRACRCGADFNRDGALDILDFVAFQLTFQSGDMAADCDGDGVLSNPLDFVCFQGVFTAGCR